MNNHFLSLRVSSGIFLASCFSLGLFSNASHGDEITDLISKSEASGANSANLASSLIHDFRNKATKESTSASKIAGSRSLPSGSAKKYPKQEALKDIPLPHEGKGKCKDKDSKGSGKCPSSLFESMEAKQAANSLANTQLLIFVSQSVPADSIKELWNQVQKVGGKLVFRGLVGGSFKETQSYIQELGVVADIDPTKFEEFGIIQVPAFVLSKEGKHDKMVGNISLNEFLEQSSSSGDLKKEASDLYKKLQGEQP